MKLLKNRLDQEAAAAVKPEAAVKKSVVVALVGGGTAGHIKPLLSVAKEIKQAKPDWQVNYLGSYFDKLARHLVANSDDERVVDKANFVLTGKFRRYSGFSFWQHLTFFKSNLLNLRDLFFIIIGLFQTVFHFVAKRPTVIFSKGGYPAFLPVMIGFLLRIPVISHDSDSVGSLSNSLAGKLVKLHLTGFKTNDPKAVFTGTPVSEDFRQISPAKRELILKQVAEEYGLPDDAEIILVLGGSLGARNINGGIMDVIDKVEIKSNTYFIINAGSQASNHEQLLELKEKIKRKDRVRIITFTDRIANLIHASVGVVTRAGANALSELSLAGKPIIIIPQPFLPRKHQIHNAQFYYGKQAAWVVKDDGEQVARRALIRSLNKMINDPQARAQKTEQIIKLSSPKASKNIVRQIIKVVSGHKKEDNQESKSRSLLSRLFGHTSSKNIQEIEDVRRKSKRYKVLQQAKRFSFAIIVFIVGSLVLVRFAYVDLNRVDVEITTESILIGESEQSKIREEVQAIMTKRPPIVRNLSLPSSEIANHLSRYSYIGQIEVVKRPFRSDISIKITPRKILGKLESPLDNFLITSDGYVLDGYDDDFVSAYKDFRVIVPFKISNEAADNASKAILLGYELSFITEFRDYLVSVGRRVDSVFISTNEREMIFELYNHDFQIITLVDEDPVKQAIVLDQTLRHFEGLAAEQASELSTDEEQVTVPVDYPEDYVDVRLINRVFYK